MAQGTGTITSLNGTVTAATEGSSTVVFSVSGTWSANIVTEATNNDQDWFLITGLSPQTTNIFSIFASNLQVAISCGGYSQVRLRASAFTSGTINVSYDVSSGDNIELSIVQGNINTTEPSYSSGAIAQISIDTFGRLRINSTSCSGYYSIPVNIRQSATTAANATVFSMRNAAASTKTVYIERIELLMAFDTATPITRSTSRYDLVRFSAATPTGGTAVTVVAMDSSASATQVTDVRFLDTGLTTTGVSFGTSFTTIGCPATDATTTKYQRSGIAIKLAAGEGICIRLNVAAVVGQSLTGEIVWSER